MGGKPEPDRNKEKVLVGIAIAGLLLLGVLALSVTYVNDQQNEAPEPESSVDPSVEFLDSPEAVELQVSESVGAGDATVVERDGGSVVVSGVLYGSMGGMTVVADSVETDNGTLTVEVGLESSSAAATTVITEYQYSFEIQSADQYERVEVVHEDGVTQLRP